MASGVTNDTGACPPLRLPLPPLPLPITRSQ